MAISKTAQANHKELFPDLKSTLKVTDPEFIEIFDNFNFDEVLQHQNLDLKLRMKITLAALIAMQSVNEYQAMLNGALNVGVTPVEVKEIVYQATAYVGLGKVFDFLHATNAVFTERHISLPIEGQSTTTPATRYEKGLETVRQLAGDAVDKMQENLPENEKHFATFLADNCFGDYYTRKGLDAKARELITFAMLISLGGADPQVKGHIRNNVTVGNDKDTLLSAITVLLPFIGYPRTLTALNLLNEIIPENN
ncbi:MULTISPECIES: carboxymuconolactone decarboxylase family protein [Lactiplantibacillus]|uniref:carboxymuconolactone decarboxylase family protein n=1 Tax=Lactiplantibacillus TaxID=2767842 RepID=UPI001C1F3394|nr:MULTISPECIES: carboxymuconolactone decarboxylase family protein [Lactiplantibacillus]MBU7449151.1 carboxymuconolactone decarboxylase family protein [Lactiplantibacillus sp. 7.2.4]MBU7481540.1 carboxymuconolactone decarboxylase family protein [Lactiplantibacillus pentosus]MDY1546263.1 carboxymuconolactone decarboxylase family protein [Lactiplantibacillus pentosus]